MTVITIEVKWNMMKVHEKKLKRSRLAWRGDGLEVYVLGSLQGGLYEEASHLALIYAESIHVPLVSMRRINNARKHEYEKPDLIASSGVSQRKRLL